MRILALPTIWTLILDFAAWLIFHVAAALAAFKMPDRFFEQDRGIYKTRAWEKEGRFWQDIFHIKKWKHRLPDGASITRRGFAKKRLLSVHPENLGRFVIESRRAELTHLLAMPPALLFFLWNPPVAGVIMILYAILVNGPCLIAQRYNRPRFQRILSRKQAVSR